MKIFLIFILSFLVGCATRTKETDRLTRSHRGISEEVKLKNVPFIEQDKYLCGPSSVAMVLNHHGRNVSVEKLTAQMYTKKVKGTFQTEMISSVRNHGLLPIPLKSLESVLKEVEAGNPVIVFQNLAFSAVPMNHYAVVTGYDLDGPDVLLHSGKKKFDEMDMRLFERSWILGGKWAMLALPPENEPVTINELSYLHAASSMEEIGMLKEAEIAYQTALKKWPGSLPALMGLSNIVYQRKKYHEALTHLQEATTRYPTSALAWHNRAYAEAALGKKKAARLSSRKAIEFADESLKSKLSMSLRQWL